jgi:hypothetical protein
MADDLECAAAADARETTQADWVPPGRADLARRLEQMADKHPSSRRYEAREVVPQPAQEGRTEAPDTAPADGGETPADRAEADGGKTPAGRAEADGSEQYGWQPPQVRDRADRPDPDILRVPDDRARHILEGDDRGGGHRHGTGREGKTEFPENWPAETIVSMVGDVASNPDAAERQPDRRLFVVGERDGVQVTVVVRPNGRIWTAWPEPGGRGVIENPRT